jgi:cardiolipin synthase
MNYKKIPNILTTLRVLLIVPCNLAWWFHAYHYALTIFCVSSITDGVDGFLARRFDCQTSFGRILDPIADKLLLMSLFCTLTITGALPEWLVIVVILRDMCLLVGGAVHTLWIGPYAFHPSWMSKVNTALQMLLIFIVLLSYDTAHWMNVIDTAFFDILIATVAMTSVYTGLDYGWQWMKEVVRR